LPLRDERGADEEAAGADAPRLVKADEPLLPPLE
jgi:hypothetical protein